jgi:imidazole glycerol-phosphate synthase subunit HisF
MRHPVRVIPRLDIKGENLVKGIHLEGLRVLGDPAYFARHYADAGADELLFMDAVASLYGRNSLLGVVEKTARNVFIPMTVGGGIRSLDDIAKALSSGADKIAINTAAVTDPIFISKAAERYGSSTIVVHIDAKRQKNAGWRVWTENGREPSNLDAVTWAAKAASLGCGEIIVTSIDAEGTTAGYDEALLSAVCDAVSVPVVACGGAQSPNSVAKVAAAIDLSAMSMASILHYGVSAKLQSEGYDFGAAGEFQVLAEKRDFSRVDPTTIAVIKTAMAAEGIDVRQVKLT